MPRSLPALKKEDFDGKRPNAVYFSKRVNEAVDPHGEILSHSDMVDSLDYEAELGVIIGKDAKKCGAGAGKGPYFRLYHHQ